MIILESPSTIMCFISFRFTQRTTSRSAIAYAIVIILSPKLRAHAMLGFPSTPFIMKPAEAILLATGPSKFILTKGAFGLDHLVVLSILTDLPWEFALFVLK